MLKPLTYFRRNVLELPSIHCSSGRANCAERQRSDEPLSFAVSKHRTQLANRTRALCDDGHRLLSTIYSQGSAASSREFKPNHVCAICDGCHGLTLADFGNTSHVYCGGSGPEHGWSWEMAMGF